MVCGATSLNGDHASKRAIYTGDVDEAGPTGGESESADLEPVGVLRFTPRRA
jgi:hypothetical protein